MPSPLFSTFKTGENRVTSSTMAVFERIDLTLVLELLEKAAGLTGRLNAVSFENQVTTSDSVPDARIAARFCWWFETKTERNAYSAEGHGRTQLRNHARQLAADPDAVLFVLTPDPEQPQWFGSFEGIDERLGPRITWMSFRDLADAIDEVLGDSHRLVGEQTKFLLGELRAFYEAEGLLSNDDVVIVAARVAWDDYRRYSAYICQPKRAFKNGLRYVGFYRAGQIEDRVPSILRWLPTVLFTHEEAQALGHSEDPLDVRLGDVIRTALAEGARTAGETYGVMLLSATDDEETIRLPRPIRNDMKTVTGRSWAWTLGQRYTSRSRLDTEPKTTSELSDKQGR